MTPYQYTYLNFLNGKTNKAHKKFENDYWGASLKELLKTSYFKENKINKVSICGANPDIVKKYIHKTGHINITFTKPEESNYIIMSVFIFYNFILFHLSPFVGLSSKQME